MDSDAEPEEGTVLDTAVLEERAEQQSLTLRCTFEIREDSEHECARFALGGRLEVKRDGEEEFADAGVVRGDLVRRCNVRDEFHDACVGSSSSLCGMALTLFDRWGNLRKELGGTFGPEINEGTIAFISTAFLRKKYRGKRLGDVVVRKLLGWLCMGNRHVPECLLVARQCSVVIVNPTVVPDDCDEQRDPTLTLDKLYRFCRRTGFRRIADTKFMACVLNDPTHPCHDIAATDLPSYELHAQVAFDRVKADPVCQAIRRKDIALAVKIILAADAATLDAATALHCAVANKEPLLVRAILARWAHANHVDAYQSTPLHVACARGATADIVRMLLRAGASISARDHLRRTPFDVLVAQVQSRREFCHIFAMPWLGIREETQQLLRLLAPTPLPPNAELKWGCTCGQCANGWLSPETRFRLQHAAVASVEICKSGIDYVKWDKNKTKAIDKIYMLAVYLPSKLRHKAYKSFAYGWLRLFQLIGELLRLGEVRTARDIDRNRFQCRSCVPDPGDVDPVIARAQLEFYFARGGKARYALEAVLDFASETSKYGGNGESDRAYKEELARFPQCANDGDFALARTRLTRGDHKKESQPGLSVEV
eukprot:TRINITY_DN1152_c0_g1_i14.p1 TRINITY_DN1152_c0_g1~~TRINITY_DN1152_c0_g1_i14.p1  ORF type:complete len:598 (-),score=129.97 TRINITY_DN1152_c0_g1_i14:496-2289(-)